MNHFWHINGVSLALLGLLALSACGDSPSPGGTSPGDDITPECEDGERRCINIDVEVCVEGQFQLLGPCPSGTQCNFGDCVASCEPQCDGRDCGADGCGGECGQCDDGLTCDGQGQCAEAPPECGNDACDEGEDCANCPADCGQCCGDGQCSDNQGENCATCPADCGCPQGQQCDLDRRVCEDACQPQCNGRQCGDDGCGGQCGQCDQDEVCDGQGQCAQAPPECGDDACDEGEDCANCPADCGQCCGDGQCADNQGENCATCPADCGCPQGQDCNTQRRVCEDACVPQCGGRECGDDGCGGQCGQCDDGFACQAGQCVELCVPQCNGRQCGDDGCGGACGQCDEGEVCSLAGTCVGRPVACDCDQDEVCLDGICRDVALACTQQNPVGLCENGFECLEGQCIGTGANCSPQNPNGVCPVGQLCRDGQCDAFDGEALCDDDNDCTVDRFDPNRNRCEHLARLGACDDGNACTTDTCQAGVCVGAAIQGCVAPPTLEPFVTPTNVNQVVLRGTKPEGSSVEINGQEAVAESPDGTWQVTLSLAPGENRYVIRSVDQGRPSETVEIVIVFDITPPVTAITPGGGIFLGGVTVTAASNEAATVYYTTDGGTPDEFSEHFESVKQIRIFDDTQLRLRARDRAGNWEAEIVSATFEITGENNRWRDEALLPEALTLMGAAEHEGTIYLVGGSDGLAPQAGVFSYTPEEEAWLTLPSLPGGRAQVEAVTVGADLYAIGGEDDGTPLNSLLRLRPNTQAWEARAPMPSTRFGTSAVVANDRIFVFGGKTNGGIVLDTLEVYNVANNTWTNAVAQMPRARHGFGAVLHGADIIVVGGEDGEGTPIAEVDIYNITNDTWRQGAPMPTPRSFASVALNTNEGLISTGPSGVLVAGGRTLAGVATARVEEYLIEANAWRERTPLDAARHSAASVTTLRPDAVDDFSHQVWLLGGQTPEGLTDTLTSYRADLDFLRRLAPMPTGRFRHATVALDGLLYVLGGRNFQEESSLWAYDPETGQTSERASMASFQNGLAAIAFEGKVYAFGGANNFGNPVATTRAYDPATDTWQELTPMPTGRSEPAVALLGDEIYVIGGRNGVAVQSVEIYNPRTNAWRRGPVLGTGRTDAAAVAWRGDILLFGGRDPNNQLQTQVLRLRNGNWINAGNITAVANPVAVRIHDDRALIIAGRAAAGQVRLFQHFNIANNANEALNIAQTSPLDLMGAAALNGDIYVLGGNATPESTPPGADLVQKIASHCFNGRLDAGETEIDRGNGCQQQSVTYSASFPRGTPSQALCTAWQRFRAEIKANATYTRLIARGSVNPNGFTCNGPAAQTLCQALRTGSRVQQNCDGRTWLVDVGCSGQMELTTGTSDCSCTTNAFTIRACIGNENWGGINNSCSSAAQTLEVICE